MVDDRKAVELVKLREEALRSPKGGPGFVFGEGPAGARLMIVGEAPGPEEERTGRPFVGRAGRLLDRLLVEAGIRREEVYVTNVVRRRPTVMSGERVTPSPNLAEIEEDLPWLERELAIVEPNVVLCLGNVPASVLIHKGFRLFQERGKWFEGPKGRRLLATFHPAYLLRPWGHDREKLMAQARGDFEAVRLVLR